MRYRLQPFEPRRGPRQGRAQQRPVGVVIATGEPGDLPAQAELEVDDAGHLEVRGVTAGQEGLTDGRIDAFQVVVPAAAVPRPLHARPVQQFVWPDVTAFARPAPHLVAHGVAEREQQGARRISPRYSASSRCARPGKLRQIVW